MCRVGASGERCAATVVQNNVAMCYVDAGTVHFAHTSAHTDMAITHSCVHCNWQASFMFVTGALV